MWFLAHRQDAHEPIQHHKRLTTRPQAGQHNTELTEQMAQAITQVGQDFAIGDAIVNAAVDE